jgi:hypothetical protein
LLVAPVSSSGSGSNAALPVAGAAPPAGEAPPGAVASVDGALGGGGGGSFGDGVSDGTVRPGVGGAGSAGGDAPGSAGVVGAGGVASCACARTAPKVAPRNDNVHTATSLFIRSTVTSIASPVWRWARALSIALVIVLGLISGFPTPNPERVAHAPALIRWLVERIPGTQSALLTPFRFATADCQIAQRWTLFSTTGGIRYRMEIEARDHRSRRWKLLYRAQDPEHAFMAPLLEYRRVRNGWNPSRHGIKQSYEPFTLFISRNILEREPHLDRVRVRMARLRTLPHGEGVSELGDFEYTAELGREVLR